MTPDPETLDVLLAVHDAAAIELDDDGALWAVPPGALAALFADEVYAGSLRLDDRHINALVEAGYATVDELPGGGIALNLSGAGRFHAEKWRKAKRKRRVRA